MRFWPERSSLIFAPGSFARGAGAATVCESGVVDSSATPAVAMVLTKLAAAPTSQAIASGATARARDIDRLLFCIIDNFLTAFHSRRKAVSTQPPVMAVSRWGERG